MHENRKFHTVAPRLSGQLCVPQGVRITEIVRITKIKMAVVQKGGINSQNGVHKHDFSLVCRGEA